MIFKLCIENLIGSFITSGATSWFINKFLEFAVRLTSRVTFKVTSLSLYPFKNTVGFCVIKLDSYEGEIR